MADKYGRTMYQIMLENGATEDELLQQLSGTGTPQSYLDREAQKAAAAAAARPTYAIPAQNFDGMARMAPGGAWTIDDSESATWQKIAQMANSGDTQGAINLANQLSAAGKFGGYWDDAGNYWGFAQGYTGGANASMQPVIGGKMLTPKGLEYENTGVWLTPDGKALNLGANGTLTNNGETWGTTDNRNAQAVGRWYDENGTDSKDARWNTWDAVGARMGWTPEETFANMSKSGAFLNPALNTPQGNAAASNSGSSGMTWGGPGGTPYNPNEPTNMWGGPGGEPLPYDPNGPQITPYQQALSAQSPNYSEMILTSAPEAYDPNSNTIYQQWLNDYVNGGKSAPEWAGDPYAERRDAALDAYGEKWQGSEYQPLRDQYLQNAANMKWNFNPDTDPVWQALQKQYRREGQRATEDTLGRYAAMTGGMPSTAAVTAASQAGDYYAAQLSDRLPGVYQDAYNRYLDEYKKQLGISEAYAGFDETEYSRWLDQQGKNLDLAKIYNDLGGQDYNRYRDTRQDWLDERGFRHDAATENIKYNTDYSDDQYKRYLDAVEQQNYINERMQYLKEYADSQNWKATEWQQYLREYGDQLSQQEREWVYKQMQAANDQALDLAKLGAQYGDYSGLSGLGIDTSSANPKEVAYASDGSMYKFNSPDAQYFVQNAPNGTPGNPTTMTGGDGSIWRKDEYGNVTITTKNGKTFTYSNNTPAVTGSAGKGYSGGGGTGGNAVNTYITQMQEAGITSLKAAKGWLAMNASKLSDKERNDIADYFMELLGVESNEYSDDDVSRAWDIINGKYPNANQAAVTWAQQVLSQTSGLDFGTGGNNEGSVNDPTYANLEESLDRMAANNRSRDEIFSEIDAEVRDGRITKAQGDALKQKYYGGTDNVPNSGQYHSGGKPMSTGYNTAEQQALTMYSRGKSGSEIARYLLDQINAGKIHEYESDIILNRIAKQTGGVAPATN